MAHPAGAYLRLLQHERLGAFLLPPLDVKRDSYTMFRPGLEPGPLDPESSTLTVRRPRLAIIWICCILQDLFCILPTVYICFSLLVVTNGIINRLLPKNNNNYKSIRRTRFSLISPTFAVLYIDYTFFAIGFNLEK